MVEDVVRRYGYLALGSRLRRIGERLQADVQEIVEAHALPILAHHYPLLYALDENGPLEIGQLARAVGVSQPGVTRSINQLEAAGCVKLSAGARDKRVRRVELSETGKQIMQVGRGEIAPLVLDAFGRVFEDKPDELLMLLDRLEDALDGASLAELGDSSCKELHHE